MTLDHYDPGKMKRPGVPTPGLFYCGARVAGAGTIVPGGADTTSVQRVFLQHNLAGLRSDDVRFVPDVLPLLAVR
jgi:hypothetical protein